MFKFVLLIGFAVGLNACQSMPSDESAPPTAKEVAAAAKAQQKNTEQQSDIPNPAKCQQAKLDLVQAEGTGDVGTINFAKDAVHRYCDDFE